MQDVSYIAKCQRRSHGFTLIELMVTVAIVGILAAVAYPSYLEHVRKSRRAEAQQALMSEAGRQQQFLLDTRSYTDTFLITVPAFVQPYYTLTLQVTTSPSFTITATPLLGQAADKCGALALTAASVKTPATCW